MVPVDADLVIATNFPSYFVRHRRKVVWLFHQHRSAYDAADMPWSDFVLEDAALEDQRLLADWDTRVLEEAERLYTTSTVVADRLLRFNGLRATALYHPPPLYTELRPGPSGDYIFCATRLEASPVPGRTCGSSSPAREHSRASSARWPSGCRWPTGSTWPAFCPTKSWCAGTAMRLR
jgi:hypothetical protein